VSGWAPGLATVTSGGAALLVFLLYAPALQAPFLVPKFAALELMASLGLVSFALRRATTGGPRWAPAVTLGALLVLATSAVAWGAATIGPVGAPYAVDAMARWGSLLGLACGVSVIADLRKPRQRVLETCTVAAAVVAAIGLLQHLELAPLAIPVFSRPGSTFGNRNLAAEVMAMALPLGVAALAGAQTRTSRVGLVVALGLELVFLAITRARGAWIGAACGLGVVLWLARERLSSAIFVVAVGAVAAAAVAASVPGRLSAHDAGDVKRYSGVVELLETGLDARGAAVRTRLGLWRRTTAMVHDHPVLGVGPGNWPVVFPRYAEPGATEDGVLSATHAPRQAHDDLLERAAETGVPGLIALGALAAGTAMAARRRWATGEPEEHMIASAAAGALVALVGLSLTSFPLEMPGTIALGGLALGLVAPERNCPAPMTPKGRAYIAVFGALALVPFAAVRAERNVKSSFWLGAAERGMRRDPGSAGAVEALGYLEHALEARPSDYRAELRTAQMLLRERRSLDSERAARRALATEPYAPNAWAALAAAELAADNDDGARRDATQTLTFLADYPFALDVRAKAAERAGDVASARADRQRVEALASGSADGDTAREARALMHAEASGTR
jgi:O-antigen ligase